MQGDDSPGRIQQRFKANPGTTVYGVRSYWEGFDAPGETLSYLLIETALSPPERRIEASTSESSRNGAATRSWTTSSHSHRSR